MRRRCLLLSLTAIPFLVVPAMASTAGRGVSVEGCRFVGAGFVPSKVRLLAATRETVAFTGQSADGRAVYACRRGSRVARLGLTITCPLGCSGVRAVDLGDRYAAFESLESGSREGDDFDNVVVYDLTSRKAVSTTAAGGYSRVLGDPPFQAPLPGEVFDLITTSAGSVAWIAQDQRTTPTSFSVWTRERGKSAERRALGPDVAPGSLARSPNRIYWTQGGAAASAPLT